jgi:hypothetical protein
MPRVSKSTPSPQNIVPLAFGADKANFSDKVPVERIMQHLENGAGLMTIKEQFPALNSDITENVADIMTFANAYGRKKSTATQAEIRRVVRIIKQAQDVFAITPEQTNTWFLNTKLKDFDKTPAQLIAEDRSDIVLYVLDMVENTVYA